VWAKQLSDVKMMFNIEDQDQLTMEMLLEVRNLPRFRTEREQRARLEGLS